MQLQRGQRLPVSQLTPGQSFELRLDVRGSARDYDAACFAVDAADRLPGDANMTFYNQPASPDGSVRYSRSGGEHRFQLDLGRVDGRIQKLVFTVTPDGGDLRGVSQGTLSIGEGSWTFSGADFGTERAIMAAELYLRNGEWRLSVVGQGFAGGLEALVKHFGGDVAPAAPAAAPTPPPSASPPSSGRIDVGRPGSTPAPSAQPSGPPISLTKVTLQKQGDSARISLRKGEAQPVHVNLNWDQAQPQKRGGFLGGLLGGGGQAQADLDLGCMYLLKDGERGVIQALGGNFGARTEPPYIWLDRDDRSGAVTGGENLYIERPDLIERVLIFAFIYEGAANFQTVGGRLSLQDPQGNEIKMSLSNPSNNLAFCAVALIEQAGSAVSVRKEERYYEDHPSADAYFGFGFNWKVGRK